MAKLFVYIHLVFMPMSVGQSTNKRHILEHAETVQRASATYPLATWNVPQPSAFSLKIRYP